MDMSEFAEARVIQSPEGKILFQPDTMRVTTEIPSADDLLQGRAIPAGAPDFVRATINVVKGCVAACLYCPYGSSASAGRRILKMEAGIGRRIVDFLCRAFPDATLFRLSFTPNGEPSLNMPVIEAIKAHAARKSEREGSLVRFRFNFATNAIPLDFESLESLGSDPKQDVFFSIDGFPELHDRIRGMSGDRGSYDIIAPKVAHYREHCREWGKILGSSTVLTALDPRFDDILLHLEKLGFESIVMRPIRGANDASWGLNPQSVEVFLEGYRRMIDLVEERAVRGDIDLLLRITNRYDFFGRLLSALILGEERLQGCPGCAPGCSDYSRTSLVFDVNGDVYYPCRDFIGRPEYLLGNIDGAVDLDRMRREMDRLSTVRRPACRACWARTLCGGGCYNATLLSTGQVFEPDANLCRIITYLAERAIRLAARLAILQPEKLETLRNAAAGSSPWRRS
jgi:uncharacterized protein